MKDFKIHQWGKICYLFVTLERQTFFDINKGDVIFNYFKNNGFKVSTDLSPPYENNALKYFMVNFSVYLENEDPKNITVQDIADLFIKLCKENKINIVSGVITDNQCTSHTAVFPFNFEQKILN